MRALSKLATLWALVAAVALLSPQRTAHAFCGFYVSGADAELYNNATVVVLMRDGTMTVLSMQNNYEGPPEDFAMVVPVPVVLQQENVQTLPHDVFDRVDTMAAPRLVEYWEIDPCWRPEPEVDRDEVVYMSSTPEPGAVGEQVVIEAQFEVGEYDIVVLSAADSGALDAWLRTNGYRIPEGAEPVLRPYVASQMKFFVAKVNVDRVTFRNGQAMLSPLRFHYDSDDFSLPVRLGLLNSQGYQDLLVHILAVNQRYEVANYPNATIPTNVEVSDEVRDRFGEFYAALFDKTLESNPGAVITEYAWDAATCDPCPGPTLSESDFQTLGADVIPSQERWGFVLTRLHARYTSDTLGEDLVFRAAPPIVGGREFQDEVGGHEPRPSTVNNFQGRYIIRHPWEGKIDCSTAIRGRWGGPPGGASTAQPRAARDLAFAPRGEMPLAAVVRQDIPALGIEAELALAAPLVPTEVEGSSSWGRTLWIFGGVCLALLATLVGLGFWRRRTVRAG